MIHPTIRCANPECEHEVSMPEALRVGTRLYCSFGCANGFSEEDPARTAATPQQRQTQEHLKAG